MSTPELSERSIPRQKFLFCPRDRRIVLGQRTLIMGVVNVTPDSFFEDSRFFEKSRAVERCLQLVEEGADLLDIGGESSRPGSRPLPLEDELERVIPVLQDIRGRVAVPLSVDTTKSPVAREALTAGADIINDISALRFDPELAGVVSSSGAGIVLMHMRGVPENMQQIPASPDILREIRVDFDEALRTADEAGIRRDRILIDPGIGFGKTVDDNLKILNRLSFLQSFQLPILVGSSRKTFIGKILGVPPEGRLMGTTASVSLAVARGAHIVRVHDVKEMRDVVAVADAIVTERMS